MGADTRLPPGVGLDLGKQILFNIYQDAFHTARRLRKCLSCQHVGPPTPGTLQCAQCLTIHKNNTTFPRLYHSLHLRAGRRSGKSLAGAHAIREELLVPGQKWWVTGPSFKHLHDATMPTLLRLIPEKWVKKWNQENLELTLINDSVAQFRSLDDPERARGQGLDGVWLDEAAFIAERAWQVLEPSLAENAGVAISTTSPAGFDWTYDAFFKKATIDHEPGYWAAQFETLDNPLFQQSPILRQKVEAARRSMPADVFAAEYQGRDVNFSGSVYGSLVEPQILDGDDAVRKLIPEWPNLDSTRQIVIGLDSGADHPFGAVMLTATAGGLVVMGEYLERNQAMMTHLAAIQGRFGTSRFGNIKWAANKNERQLRLEFGLRGVGVIPAENLHTLGIQRVQSWLTTRQMFFVRSRCPILIEQMKAYRYADNYLGDGQKREKEEVFKKKDELPDALRYATLAWPELPKVDVAPLSEREQKRWDALDETSKLDIERIREYNDREKTKHLQTTDKNWPIGDFWGGQGRGESSSIF
jgi:phage terminase large subunit